MNLPHNVEIEQAVLGVMIIYPEAKAIAKRQLTALDFYHTANQALFEAILNSGDDLISVVNTVQSNGYLEKLKTVGGVQYILDLAEAAVTSAAIDHHIEVLKNLSRRRRLALISMHCVQNASDLTADFDSLLASLKRRIRQIETDQQGEYRNSAELVKSVFKDIERRAKEGDHYVGILSGFEEVDKYLHGFEPKTLTYIIGRPSMGKTAFALNIAENMAQQKQGLVVFFSLEMGDEQIMRRRLAAMSGVYLSRIRSGDVEDSQWPALVEAADKVASADFVVIDRPKYKVIENLTALTQTFAMEQQLAVVFVDHIQLMTSRQKFNSRHLEISHISSELKALAKDINAPVIALSQLNREVEKRKNQRPQLADMRESGSLEQDADIVIGIYRAEKDSEIMELGGLKGRDTGTWVTRLIFDRFTQKCSTWREF